MGFFEDLFEGGHHRRRFGSQDQHERHDSDDHGRHGDDHRRYDDRADIPHPPAGVGGPAPTTTCRGCNVAVAQLPGVRFCPFCGASLGPPTCRSCGAAAATGASFCAACGQRL
jgi:hypothetical protein